MGGGVQNRVTASRARNRLPGTRQGEARNAERTTEPSLEDSPTIGPTGRSSDFRARRGFALRDTYWLRLLSPIERANWQVF